MIYLSNQNIAQLLTSKDCIEALNEAFHALARGEAGLPAEDRRLGALRAGR